MCRTSSNLDGNFNSVQSNDEAISLTQHCVHIVLMKAIVFLSEEFSKDKKKFMKNAEEFTKKHSEKRPSD